MIGYRESIAFVFAVSSLSSYAVVLPDPTSAFLAATCDIPSAIGKPPSDRWIAAKADAVLNYANTRWNQNKDYRGEIGLSYLNSMWNLFNKPDAACDITPQSCDFSSETCHDKNKPDNGLSSVGNTPGAWAIRQSLTHLHSYYYAVWVAIGQAQVNISQQLVEFVDTFAPATQESVPDKILASLLEWAFELVVGKLSEGLIERVEDASEKIVLEAGKDLAMSAKASAEEIQKIQDQSQSDKASQLANILNSAVGSYRDTIVQYLKDLMSGSAKSLNTFHNLLKDGQWLKDHVNEAGGFPAMEKTMADAFAATLLASTWKLNDGVQPIILMERTPAGCDMGEPSSLMPKDVTHMGGSCVRSGSGVTLFLVGFNKKQCQTNFHRRSLPYDSHVLNSFSPASLHDRDRTTISASGCEHPFVSLPGIDKLGDWGMSKDEIIGSVYDTYVAHGSSNPKDNAVAAVYTDGTRAQGLYQIPICELRAVEATYKIGAPKAGLEPLCDYGVY